MDPLADSQSFFWTFSHLKLAARGEFRVARHSPALSLNLLSYCLLYNELFHNAIFTYTFLQISRFYKIMRQQLYIYAYLFQRRNFRSKVSRVLFITLLPLLNVILSRAIYHFQFNLNIQNPSQRMMNDKTSTWDCWFIADFFTSTCCSLTSSSSYDFALPAACQWREVFLSTPPSPIPSFYHIAELLVFLNK